MLWDARVQNKITPKFGAIDIIWRNQCLNGRSTLQNTRAFILMAYKPRLGSEINEVNIIVGSSAINVSANGLNHARGLTSTKEVYVVSITPENVTPGKK